MASDDMHIESIKDAYSMYTSHRRVRHYFAMLLMHCQPSNPQKLFDTVLDYLFPPRAANTATDIVKTEAERREIVLRHVEYYLRLNDKTCKFVCILNFN